ncbi:Hypothetical protein CINCED_3A004473 [Cinara cedri]|uniref:Uncharacterized protein n=1 Tax=Cinara cedri TaxID=506608 RepID=A0A5E4MDU1_9HEMI|nr:Hypothetical protein CINCED_3A004473 [Cinara cedri]
MCNFGKNLEDKFIRDMKNGRIKDRLYEEELSIELNVLIDIAAKRKVSAKNADATDFIDNDYHIISTKLATVTFKRYLSNQERRQFLRSYTMGGATAQYFDVHVNDESPGELPLVRMRASD